MLTTNNKNQIKKETASVKHYTQTKKDKKYITKRINLDSKSKFADNERVIVIAENDFNSYYETTVNLDDFRTDPADANANADLEDLQSKYNDLRNDYEEKLKEIAKLEREKAEIKDNHFEELQDQQTKYDLLKTKYAESLSALDKANAINTANYETYITVLDNISLQSKIAIKSAISDAVKQTTNYNNAEISKLNFFRRLRKFTLTAPVIEDDKEIFAPAFAEIEKAIDFFKFDKLE